MLRFESNWLVRHWREALISKCATTSALYGVSFVANIKQKKIRLRKQLRAKRRNLSNEERHSASKAISRQIRNLDDYKKAEKIGVYLATPEEISLDPFIDAARKDKKILFLPVISKFSGEKQMHLQSWSEHDELTNNRFGIAEPKQIISSQVTPSENDALDLLLIPVVGYTNTGVRLGMGAGYYDRYLEKQDERSNTIRIGIAHSCQNHDEIPQEEWDKKMHFLVHENAVIRFLIHTPSNFY